MPWEVLDDNENEPIESGRYEVLDDVAPEPQGFWNTAVSPAINTLMGGIREAGETYNRPLPSGGEPTELTKVSRLFPFQPQGSTLYNMGGDVLGGVYGSGFVGGIGTAKYLGTKAFSPESREIMGEGMQTVTEGLQNPQNYISPVMFNMAVSAAKKGKQAFDKFMQYVPPETAHTLRSTLNYMGLIPTIKAVNTAGEAVNIGRDFGNAAREAWAADPLIQASKAKTAESLVKSYTDKNILSLAKGMSTPKDYNNLVKYMNFTMNDVIDNPKSMLRLDPDTGAVSLPFEKKGFFGGTKEYTHIPQSAEDMSTAWQMRMDAIAGTINKRISLADQAGVSIPLDSQIEALRQLRSKYEKSLRGRDASVLRTIDYEIDSLTGKKQIPGVGFANKPYASIEDAQRAIEVMNSKLDKLFNNTGNKTWVNDPHAQILIVKADAVRKDIDRFVDSLTGEGVKDLKAEYKAYRRTLQAINKQMIKAAGFKSDYVSELTNVVSGSMLVKALATGKWGTGLAALTGREIAAIQHMMKNPDRRVRKAFQELAKIKRNPNMPSRSQSNKVLNPLMDIDGINPW